MNRSWDGSWGWGPGLTSRESREPGVAPSPGGREVLIAEPKVLECVENRIYFYAEIDRETVLILNKTLRNGSVEIQNMVAVRDMKEPYPLFLHVMSFGGSIFAGLAAMDQILAVRKKVPIVTVVDGCCASAATFLTVVGTRRIISPNSYMLIHQLSSMFWGKWEEYKDEMENLRAMMARIKGIYAKYAKVPETELDEILKHDLWVDPKKCLEWGLVDEIAEE